MIHKILGRLASACSFVFAAIALAGFTSFATDYIDATGNPASATCTQITSSTTTLETGWYVVEGPDPVSISSTVTVNGDANLILADGAKLTVSVSESYKAGILVANDGTTVNTLTIWCQSGGTGELVVSGGFFAAGIGGDYATTDCGAVTIYGGSITATGNYGAGIGGGTGGAGGDVAINGGTVVARDGSSGDAAGIGRGAFSSKSQGTLTVSDKIEVLAGSSESTASLLTRNSDTGAVTISGQKWFFAGPQSLHQGATSFTAYSGAAGSAVNIDLTDTIKGGTGVYTFGLKDGSSLPEWLTLSGTTLSGTPVEEGSSTFTFVVEDTSEPKLSLEATYTVVVKDRYSITYKDGESTLSLYPTNYIKGTGVSTLPTPTKASHEFQGWFTNALFAGTQFTSISTTDSGDFTFYSKWLQLTTGDVSVTFVGEGSAPITKTCTIVESSMTTLSDTGSTEGWYVVYNNVAFNSSVTISGNVKLVLMDGKTMTAEIPNGSSISKAAVTVTPGNSLTIYGQANGSGRIEATATSISAGIGGGWSQDCGSVTINGGTVIAKSTSGGPGIGGGYQKAGGTVTINGGTVIATGASSTYPGIGGGGSSYEQGKLYVGANVIVKAGSSSTLTDANIQPHVDGQIDLTTCYQYYSAETVGPAPLVQINSAFSAYIGEAFELSLPGTVSGGTDPYSFTLKTPASLPSWLSRTGDTLSGTPAAVGDSCELTFTVADSGSPAQNAEFTYTITVTALPKPITYMNGTVEITGLTPSNYVEGVGATLPTTAPAASGYELEGWYLTPACDGEKVTAISAEATGPQTFYANWAPIEYTITYKDSETLTDLPASALPANAPTTYTIEAATTLPATATKAGKGFYGWYLTSACIGDPETSISAGQTGPKTFYAKWGIAKSNETYIDASGHEQVVECTEIGSDTTSLATGWYVVKGNVSTYSKVTVSGNVNLILADDAVYTVSVSSYGEAIMIKGDNSLTIYGGVAGTGALNVSASSGPAIGANNDTSSHFGTLTVYGGNVTANGSYCGIGGGYNTPGGDVYVYGGTVIANGGGSSAAGIGGYGSSKTTGTLTVAENVVVMTKTSDYGASYVMKPHGENGAITLEGEQYYKLITPKTATIPYRDTDGVVKNATCTLVTADINSFDGGWYAVTGDLDFGSAGIFISGDVKLIVADGASLTVAGLAGSPYSAGINVPDGASLTVYGQAEGTGAITATGGSFSAGIGGGYQQSAGTITINGGNITAIGNTQWAGGAGIGGGGNKGNGGTVVINGGRVEATGNNASGIGKGSNGTSEGTLTVDASMVVMAGTNATSAVELPRDEITGTVELSSDKVRTYFLVERTGPKPLSQVSSTFDVYKDEAVNLSFADTVSGGTKPYTFAYKSGSLPAGISSATFSGTPTEAGTFVFVVAVTDSGVDAEAQNEDFTYTLTVTAKPKAITYYNGAVEITGLTPSNYVEGVGATLPTTAPAASGYELEGWYLTSACDGDKVTTISAEATGDLVFYANWKATVYNVVYMKDSTTQFDDPAPTTYTVESETLILPTTAVNAGKAFYGWYENSGCLGTPTTSIPHGSTGDKTFYAKWGAVKSNETYVNAAGVVQPAVECAEIASDTTTLETGWYIVKDDVTITTFVTVSGDASIILADGATLTITSDNSYKAGINVLNGNSLTVYSQTAAGTGAIDATGGALAAGIGGEWNGSAGTVTINGGSVTATGGNNCAGIGGGSKGNGGVVVVNNGTVMAKGGDFGAGIGGGYEGSGGTVTINGGTVTAYSSGYGAGIGKGYTGSSAGSLTVGANMVVESGDDVGSLTELGTGGAITLDGLRYYVVRKAGVAPLAQTASAFAAYVGEVFELNLDDTVRGGSGSYLFTLKDSTLPAWLTRTGNVLSGTPTAEGVSSFTYTVADSVETTVADLDCTYTITASIRPQPITYMDGSEVMKGLTPSNYIEGVGVELPETASKTGYLFLGWYTAATGGERVYSVSVEATGPQTFYAHWTTAPYTITYMDGDTPISGLTPANYDIESATINLPEPLAPEGKVFVGWFTDAGFNTPATTIPHGSTGPKTFYVKWRDAEAGEGEMLVSFINGDGTPREEMCKVMTSAMTTLETGWYVVNNDLTVNSSVTIDGNVNIVLVDGKTLTVNANNAWATAGIAVAAGNSLSIYGQAEGTGSLNATGGDYGAGIGSGYNKNAGNVTINGGTVTATGHDAAGIGGATSGVCGTVTVNRGTVVGTGGGMCPGIGSGSSASAGGTVIINGGDVTATGGSGGAAGIGGGNNCPGGIVTITGGTVVATGTNGAGIGGSGSGAGAAVTITGGSVSAIAGAAYRYGIGGGNTATDQGSLTVGDGMVVRAGEGENPADELDVASNGAVTLVAHRYYVVDDGSAPIGPTLYEIQYFDGRYNQIQVEPSKYEAGTVTVLGTPAEKPGYVFVGWYTQPNFNSEKVTQIGANETGVKMFYAKWEKASERAVVNYLDVDGVEKSVECTIISGEKDLLTNGWYAVTNSVTLTHGLGVTNDVRLVIADNVTLTVSNGTFGKVGIHVPSDSFLTIFGQSGDSGVLSVTGGSYAAGIGGDQDEASSGAVTVNGGVVTAQGGSKGAGIGGGNSGSGGAVTINGGTVTATGGNDAAGIGGGYTGSCGAVTINGGTVTANGGASAYDSGAGIGGGGYGGSGGDVVINGGTVTATSGGRYSDGIGRGNGEGSRGTLKAGAGVIVTAGSSAATAETLDQKKDDGTFWIFDTHNYYHAEEATAESEFTITYWDEMGTSTYDLEPSTYVSGTGLAELPQPERAGYTFGGWWTSRNLSTAEQVTSIPAGSSGNMTLYARWTSTLYTITYVTDPMDVDISGFQPKAYYTGTSTGLPSPLATKPYYVFESWYTNATFVGESFTSITTDWVGDKTLYAKWAVDESKITSVTFVGSDGEQTEDCFVLDTTVSELEDGWYVVNDDLEFEGNGISVSGDVKLVIEDGKTMTVTVTRNPSQHAGINVPEGSSLAIYGQAGGTGTLVVSGGNTGGAAIGGNNNEKCGAVSVYGGRVAATGGDWGAGIGGGGHADGGAIAIYGGDVNAMGGVSAAGIGGGYEGNGGTVGIYGGVVRASSDSLNCGGIGKGLSGGAYSEIGEVELTVGENVYVQVRRPAGYADWFYVNRETGAVQISSVRPHYLVFDATTTAFPIVYMDGETELTGLLPTVYYYDVGVEDGLPVPDAPAGYAFAGWFDNPDLEGDPIDAISEREAGEITLWAKWHKLETVTYIDQYGVGHNKECRVFDPGTTQLWDGEWYVVKEDIKIEGGIAVLGEANLILADGITLHADSSVHNYKAGVSVPQGSMLTVYAQSEGDDAGRLYAVGGFSAAGIGGDEYISCGTVIINGGQVLAQGGDSGAGIGGGIQGTGGDVIINGGIVDAIGYEVWCVGIGGGLSTSDNDTVMCMPHGTLTVAADRAVRVNSREMMPYVLARDPVTGEVSLENQDVILQNFRIDEAQEFAIIYMDGDTEMTGLEPASYVEGTGVTLPIATTVKKPGFTFDGWYESPDSDPDAGDEVVLSLPGTGTDLELCERTFYARWLEGETGDLARKDGVGSLAATETGVFTEWALAGDVIGGRAPISFSAKDGTRLPPGLTVSGTTLSGTIARAGTYNFTLTVSDSLHAPQKIDIDYTIVVTGDPAVPVFEWDENGVLTNVNLKGNTDVTIPEGVKEIGTFQFAQLDYIEHLTLPDSLERIDDYAFYGCVNLLRVTFGSGLKYIGDFAFYGCEALSCDDPSGLYFPDSVEHIGEDAFKKTGLMRVSVPGGLYTPGGYIHPAFYYENTDVVYRTDETVFYILPGGGLWSVDSKANTDIVIPNTVEIILSGAFEFNETIEKVTIPNTVTNIYVKGFQGCSKLASVIIPDSVRRIGAAAFDSCSSLKSVVVPDSVTELGESVFWGCSSLESVTLGTGVVEIDDFAFAECTSLQSIDIRGNLERIGIFAFWRCSSLSGELRLPGSITQICSWSFQECTSLNSLVVPDTSVVIYPWAFEGCHGLYSVNIGGEEVLAGRRRLLASSARGRVLLGEPEKSITIGTRAFHGCTGLETAIIGKNVDSIEGGAFSNCPKLDSVTVEEGNDNYMVGENGILLTKDGQTLVSAFGKETAIAVQSTVKIIADGAFADYKTLQSVVLPSGVTTISEAAFSNATAFATITIPQSVKTIGANAFFDTILATVHVAEGDTSRVRTLIAVSGYETNGVRFIEDLPAQVAPSIAGDDSATVTGDAESGYVVTPSTTVGTVEVEIPSGLDPAKVTVEVPATASVKPNGANVAVVKTVDATSYDITAFLDIPAADANGVINLGDATVKDEIIEEVLDPEEGAVLVLTPENPSITTAETRPGLTYTFYEGTTLQNMTQKAVKVGDGNAWMPTITVKGGTSGFYSVSVTK